MSVNRLIRLISLAVGVALVGLGCSPSSPEGVAGGAGDGQIVAGDESASTPQIDIVSEPSTAPTLSIPADGESGAAGQPDTTAGAGGTDGVDQGTPSNPSTEATGGTTPDTIPDRADGPVVADPDPSVVAQAVVASVTAYQEPSTDAAPVATLAHPTVVGSPLVFLVDDVDGPPGWLQVHLPIQPNGTRGWIQRDEVTLFQNPYRIRIDRAEHRLQVFERGRLWIDTVIAVGTGDTPTPVGEFYLLELLAPPDPSGPYGPYAYGLSGFSEVLESFGTADTAVIGLHGTDDPSALGTDVSFGCVRMANDVIAELATTLPLGTPVTIA